MAHPQTSPRGYFAVDRLDIGGAQLDNNSTGDLKLNAGLCLSGETTDIITQDSTAVKLAGGIALSGQGSANAITQNSTAVTLPDGLTLSAQGSANAITQNSTGLTVPDGLYLSGQATNPTTQNSTGVLMAGQLRLGGTKYFGANSTGFMVTSESALPSTDPGDYKISLVVNSTGVAGIAINTTGTTWKYARMTSTINTT